MAHQEGSEDGGSCQFFIVLRRTPEWDGRYNVFGKVVEGIEVVEKISRAPLTKSYPGVKHRPAGQQIITGTRIEYR
jgi:cyclophilin family peptidyl-prolyl cis-trans isomerase